MGNFHLEDCPQFGLPYLDFEGDSGPAVHGRCGLDHVVLFLRLDAADGAVVAHPYEQSASRGVREGSEGAGNLPRVLDPGFEVLVEVLALGDHLQHVRHGSSQSYGRPDA